jgi:hypothetical protein
MGGEVVMITWKKKPLETLIWIKKKRQKQSARVNLRYHDRHVIKVMSGEPTCLTHKTCGPDLT